MKIKVSFTGKAKAEVWHVTQWADIGEPHLMIKHRLSDDRELAIVFETTPERERFLKGVHHCRGRFIEDDIVKEVYLTGYGST